MLEAPGRPAGTAAERNVGAACQRLLIGDAEATMIFGDVVTTASYPERAAEPNRICCWRYSLKDDARGRTCMNGVNGGRGWRS
jgi:hypothetical protein